MQGVDTMFPKSLNRTLVYYYTDKDDYGMLDHCIEKSISYLAICHSHRDSQFHLFYCNEEYKVIADAIYESIEECKRVAEDRKEGIKWLTYFPLYDKYHRIDLSKFDSRSFKGFRLEKEELYTKYNSIGITISLSENDSIIRESIQCLEEFVENKIYDEWLDDGLEADYKIYQDRYQAEYNDLPFIEDIHEYKKQFEVNHIDIDEYKQIHVSYRDKTGVMLGKGIKKIFWIPNK